MCSDTGSVASLLLAFGETSNSACHGNLAHKQPLRWLAGYPKRLHTISKSSKLVFLRKQNISTQPYILYEMSRFLKV